MLKIKSIFSANVMPLFRQLASYVLKRRYETFVATSEKDLQSCFNLRSEIFGKEFRRDSDSEAVIYTRADELDPDSIILACRDKRTNEIIGTARLTSAKIAAQYPGYYEEYKLKGIPQDLLAKVVIGARFCIKQNYRTGIIGYLMLKKGYEELLKHNFVVLVLVSEPGLIPMYQQLGFKPYGRIFQPSYGSYEIPLYSFLDDYDHQPLDFYLLAKQKGFPNLSRDCEQLKTTFLALNKQDHGFEYVTHPMKYCDKCHFADGLSQKGKLRIFKNAVLIKPQKNDLIVRQGSGEKYLALINKGSVDVTVDNKFVKKLVEGDIFGEIAYLTQRSRTTNVVCASEDTEIILFSYKLMRGLNKKDQDKLVDNLTEIAQHRLNVLQAKKLKE